MDSPSRNMFDTFKDHIWEELGPLDPNWFDELTIKASSEDGNGFDQDNLSTAKEDGCFKTPFKKGVLDIHHSANPMETCCLKIALHISESLGAQINPDLTWTSSLNTPPAVPSTLILFAELIPEKSDESPLPQAVDHLEVSLGRKSPESQQSSLDQSNSDWKQTLPDAIEDGELRSTVASVLEGAENVLSIFFTNSSSALRRVKTKDRIKRKQSIPTKEQGCISSNVLTTKNVEASDGTDEQKPDVKELGEAPSSPHVENKVNAVDTGITQWSPMSLSDISHCEMDTSCQVNDPSKQWESSLVTERVGRESDADQLIRPSFKNPDSTLIKKTRRFVYVVQSPDPQSQGKNLPPQDLQSSSGNPTSGQGLHVKRRETAPDEVPCYNINNTRDGRNDLKKQENVGEERLVSSATANSQDLDMSQLCRVFAQDFTQISDLSKPGHVEEDTPQTGFSPSTCLSALKQREKRLLTEQELNQGGTSLHQDCNGIRKERNETTPHLVNSKIVESMSDSGFQSTVTNVTQITGSSPVPSSLEKHAKRQPCCDFETGIQRTIPFPPLSKEMRKAEKKLTDANLHTDSTSTRPPGTAKGVAGESKCIKQNDQIHARRPEQTTASLSSVGVSGFKTASNKGIQISSVNLERAMCLFKEIEDESLVSNQPAKCSHNTGDEIDVTCESVRTRVSNSAFTPSSNEKRGDIQCALTASQKADVAELCTLLEGADTQFEFTQFKPAKLNLHSPVDDRGLDDPPKRADKELDPDSLAGIDFDDFDDSSSDAEKHLATMTPDKMSSVSQCKKDTFKTSTRSKSSGTSFHSALKKNNASSEDVFSFAKHTNAAEGKASIVSTKLANHFDRTEDTETMNKYPSTLGVGFKTAGGNALIVSKKCLSKARALFADCEEIPVITSDTGESLDNSFISCAQAQVFPDRKTGEIDVPVDSDIAHTGDFLDIKGDIDSKSTYNHDHNTRERIQNCFSNVTESKNRQVPGLQSDKHTTTSNELAKNKMDATCHGQKSGFQMASGKGITISAKAIQEANAFFKDCDDDCMPPKQDRKHIVPMTGNGCSKENNSNLKNVEGLRGNIFKEAVNGSGEFKNVNVGPAANHADIPHRDEQVNYGGLKNPVVINDMSTLGRPSLTAKPLPLPLHTISKNGGGSCVNVDLNNGRGFCTASGKKVSVSDDALTKAKSLFSECEAFEDETQQRGTLRTNHLTGPIQGPSPQIGGFQTAVSIHGGPSLNAKPCPPLHTIPKNVDSCIVVEKSNGRGFCTASGKKVSVSDEALTKAKSLFSECEAFEDETRQRGTLSASRPAGPIQAPPPHSGGFQTASGKGVAISTTALQKAKALLSEHDGVSDQKEIRTTHSNIPVDDPPPRNGGLFAASGSSDNRQCDLSKVNVLRTPSNSDPTAASEKVLLDQQLAPQKVESFLSPHETDHVKGDEEAAYRFGTTSGKGDCMSEKTANFKEGPITPWVKEDLHERPAGEKPLMNAGGPEGRRVTRPSSTETYRLSEGSSLLNLESLNLTGCTVTQQRYFAQEAMDCTKALLDDENLAGQSLTMISEKMPVQDNPNCSKGSLETQGRMGKRSVEDADMTDQPPLKRRLLAEFDRTDADSPRGSTLHPAKSCSHGVRKDRRVFKYSISLHPNITKPHSYGKGFVETRLQKTEPQQSTPQPTFDDGKPSSSKMPVFVPPFQKTTRTETPKSNVPQGKPRTPAVFVPPFKKQRTTVQESLLNPQASEDKPHHLYVTPAKANINIPPVIKTQSLAKLTNAEGKENVKTLASGDVKLAASDVKRDGNLPFDHGTEDPAPEESGLEDGLSGSRGMVRDLQSLQLARDMQDMRIRKKKRQTIRPLPGSVFLAKTSGVDRIPLRAAVNGWFPARYTQKQLYGYGVHQHVSGITSDNAESFRFRCQQFFKQEVFVDGGGVQLADGGWLIPRNDGTMGKEEFYRALCDTPGVDPKLISEEWVYNHYRWIVWKQASMERSFPATMGSLCLTPEQVLLQLKYRYDVEVDHSRRPALRKIMERDDTAAKTLVLCVCGVVSWGQDPARWSRNDAKTPQGTDSKVESPVGMVWLTDGWYAIKAQLDVPLTAMLYKSRLAVGGKLIVHGAELVGSQDACSPLEAPESLMLKICANSTRPARWDTKLGFHRDPRPFLLPISSLYTNGGPVGCVDIVILRSYPTQWMEKKPDGGFVFRSARAEENESRRYNDSRHKAMEILFTKIQANFEKEEKSRAYIVIVCLGNNKPRGRRRTLSRQDIESLQDGEELHEAVENDPLYLEARLNEQQLETLHTYRRALIEKRQAELQERYRRALDNAQEDQGSCPKRDVTPVWRLCVADSKDQPGSNVYLLNLWRPSADLRSLLKEGGRYKVYNLTTSEDKKRAGSTVQLTATKKTQFQDLQASQELLSAHFQPRISVSFIDLQDPEFHPLCGEVDLVGYVISIAGEQGASPVLYLADGQLNFVKVHCFRCLSQSGLEVLVKPLALLALSNLQLRVHYSTPIPVVYVGDLAVFSTNPKEAHLQEAFIQLRNQAQGQENFFETAKERLSHILQSDGSNVSSPTVQPRTPGLRTDGRRDTTTCAISRQPIRQLGSFTPLSRKPLPNTDPKTDTDPKSLRRRRGLDYLSRIPSPPPLCPLGTMASPCVNKTFNPPRRSETPSAFKTVQTPARKSAFLPVEDEWVNDEELAMIDTQALHGGLADLGTRQRRLNE
ncbi:breast cancer type 2 susceptibility protein [Polymixia lowei]